MKKLSLFVAIVFSFLLHVGNVSAQVWDWARQNTGGSAFCNCAPFPTNAGPTVMAIDKHGDLFVGANFWSTSITFDSITLYPTGYLSSFILKYDSSGNLLWARNCGGGSYGSYSGISSLAFDAYGNIYILGSLEDGTHWNMFLEKHDSNGYFIWSVNSTCATSQDAHGYGLALDNSGGVYICGDYTGSVTIGTSTISTSAYAEGGFLAKFDSNSNFIWVKNVDGANDANLGYCAVDPNGDIYIVGSNYVSMFYYDFNALLSEKFLRKNFV